METKDWITIIGIAIVAIGWFINADLNRKNEIAKKRLDHRLPTLNSFLELVEFIRKNNQKPDDAEFIRLTSKVGLDFQLYGQSDEIELYDIFLKACAGQNIQKALEALNTLAPLVKTRIRKELNIR